MNVDIEVKRLLSEEKSVEARSLAENRASAGSFAERVLALTALVDVEIADRNWDAGRTICAGMIAISTQSEDVNILIRLSVRFRFFRFYHEAMNALIRASRLVLDQDNPDTELLGKILNNQGLVAEDLRQYESAVRFFRNAIQADDLEQYHVNLAHVLLRLGDTTEGWRQYGYRPWPPESLKVCDPWNGQQINKFPDDVVVVQEQGAGDSIQFMRYLPWLRSRTSGRVRFFGDRALSELAVALGLLDGIEPVNEISLTQPRPLALRLLDLPAALDLPSVPVESADSATRAPGPMRVGYCWRGNSAHGNDYNRSMSDAEAQALIALMSHADWYRLQLDGALDGLLAPSQPVESWLETASLMMRLDVVVTVDTALAHLAGTLGVPTVLLLPYNSDWRWGTSSAYSSWYPSMRLCRQTTPGYWLEPVQNALEILKDIDMSLD